MEYNNKRYFGLNKNILSFLHHAALLAMLHSSFVAPAQGMLEAYIHKGESVAASGNGYYKNTDTDVATAQNTTQTQQAYPKYDVTGAKANSAYNINSYKFNADIKEGIIGVSKDKPLDSPSDNLFKVNLGQLPIGYDKVYLTYEVHGVADHHSVARSINDRLSVGGYLVKKQQGWSLQKEEIDAAWLKTGENTVLFTIPNGADYQYKIRNLSIAVEKSDETNSLLVIHNRELVVAKDNKLYIKGFLRGNHPDGKIEAGGTFLQVSNSEFEGYIPLTEDIKKNKFLVIKSTDKNDLLGQELLFIDNLIEADRIFPIERKEEAASKLFKAGTASRFDIEGAAIIANDSALAKDYDISISRLRNIDVAPMESGMINVTKGGKGYRFLPDGAKFEKPVSLSIAYDSLLIPTGYTAKDIKTYYFDTNSKRWVAVHKDSIDAKNNAIISKTTHFTDYINGIIQAPDSPETSAFAPTMMSDIKAADPSAEMTLISPPSASQKGDANIGFPVKLPAGRNGMQPQIGLQYSNEGGSSWVGQGWSLNTPAITIDTRWGSPLFDSALESESYLLAGEQLMYPDGYMPNRHKENGGIVTTDMIPRDLGGTTLFTPRKQGSFSKIERLGSSPSNYYWKVTDTEGTTYWYGGKTGETVPNINTTIKNAANNIVHWALYKVEDVYGNNIIYEYSINQTLSTVQNTTDNNLIGGKYFYIKDIFYTGFNNDRGNYHVEFRTSGQIRNDATINAKLGLKQIDPYLLNEIFISYKEPNGPIVPIRSYLLNHGTGKFGKSHLYSVMETDGASHGYKYVHNFDYYDDIRKDDADIYFSAGVDVTICNDGYVPCPDQDRDGICDENDKCPDLYGPEERQGCPEGKCYEATIPINASFSNAYVQVNGVQLGNQPYDLINNLEAFIADFQAEYGNEAQIESNGSAIHIHVVTPYGMTYIIIGSVGQNFINCSLPKNIAKPQINQKGFFRFNKEDFEVSLTSPVGDPDCPDFLNVNYLFNGYAPSFNTSASVLGSSASFSKGKGFYVGLGVGSKAWTKMTTFGFQYNDGGDYSEALTAAIDINGDGLEDLVIKDKNNLFYKPHTIERTYNELNEPEITHTFGNKLPIGGMDNFYRSYGTSKDGNFQLTAGFSSIGGFIGKNNAESYSETDIFFTDGNGDGLPDIVKDGMVYFNRLDTNGNPTFSPDSKPTENMVITAKEREIELPSLGTQIEHPGYDVVKVWEAPTDGGIKIINDIQLTDPSQSVVATIEKAGGEIIPCPGTMASDGTKGVHTYYVDFGTDIGFPGINYDAFNVPDKFDIIWNGNTYSSGYRGENSSDQDLIAAGVSPLEIQTANPSNGMGTLTFPKTVQYPTTAIVTVTAPLDGTVWSFDTFCATTNLRPSSNIVDNQKSFTVSFPIPEDSEQNSTLYSININNSPLNDKNNFYNLISENKTNYINDFTRELNKKYPEAKVSFNNGFITIYIENAIVDFKEITFTSNSGIINSYKFKLTDRPIRRLASKDMELTNMSVDLCSIEPRDLCLLYGVELNSSTSTISNVITTDCKPARNLVVRKGDRIYFRVHSNDNANPVVDWNPRIEYIDPALVAVTDANGITPYASSYSDGFILSSGHGIIFPGTSGTATISWPSFTVNPSDDVTYEIYRRVAQSNGNGEPIMTQDPTPLYSFLCSANTSTTVPAGNIPVTITAPSGGLSHTEFYFKVRSTSNVRWKQAEWRPAMLCTVSQPITGENGPEGNLVTSQTFYPIPDYAIYKPYACGFSYSKFDVAQYNGAIGLSVTPLLNGVFSSGDNGILNFVVKKGTQCVGRCVINVVNGVVSSPASVALTGYSADYELSYSAEETSGTVGASLALIEKLAQTQNAIATISWGSTTVDIPKTKINLLHKTDARFGPMYRGWGQFFYNPDVVTGAVSSPYGNLIKEEALVPDEATIGAIEDALAGVDNLDPNMTPEQIETLLNSMEANYQNLAAATAFLPANPDRIYINGGYDDKWMGLHAENYASPLSFRAAKLTESGTGFGGDSYLEQDVIKTGAYAISKCSDGNSKNISGGFNAYGGGFAGSKTKDGVGNNIVDYIDFNGDRYPDIVSQMRVQVTNPTGGLLDWEGRQGNVSISTSDGSGRTASGSFSKGGDEGGKPAGDGTGFQRFEGFNGNAGAGISGSLSNSNSKTIAAWIDINGDGLADRIERENNTLNVGLNYGNTSTTITDVASWGNMQLFNNGSSGFSAGVGINYWNGSFEAGISYMKNTNSARNTVVDMNGDGLLDFVSNPTVGDINFDNQIDVQINTGNKFYAMNDWAEYSMAKESESVSAALNGGVTYAAVWGFLGISFKIPAFGINGVVDSSSTNRTKKSITDYDGDGYPDLVEEISNNVVRVRSSNIRRTGMLKSVTNPLGGKFTVDYKVITPTYDNPNPKWVMSEVIVEDGYDLQGDGADMYRKSFEYENARYDRREREFYGFEKVKTIDYKYDSSGAPISVYRTNVSAYHNRSYFLNGLMKESYVMKGADETKLFSKSVNTYVIYGLAGDGTIDINSPKPHNFDVGGKEGRRQAAVLLTKTLSYLYELGTTPLVTEATMKYDKYGNIKEYNNSAATGVSDDYKTIITYYDDAALMAKNMIRIPKIMMVYKTQSNVMMRKRSTVVDMATGDITTISVNLNSSEIANTIMQYDQFGNLKTIVYPANQNGQNMFYQYTYDSINNKYVIAIQDAFGYQSSSTYDTRFDKVLTSTDIAGNVVTYKYDDFGRTISIISPKESAAGAFYTIVFAYYPTLDDIPAGQNCLDSNELFMPHAVTKHYDEQHPGNDIETVTLIDGIVRPVQVKKDIQMNIGDPQSPVYEERMSVSGIVEYDAFGRPFRQYHPWYEAKLCNINSVFNYYDTGEFTESHYDELDRPVLILDADENPSETSYSIASDNAGAPSFRTITSVQNDNNPTVTEVYKDVTGKVTYTKNVLTGASAQDIWTEFKYNAIGEMMSYTDAKGLATTYTYDLAGRKTEIVHPDNGKTTYEYDPANNLIRLQTANLLADNSLPTQDQYIKYSYDYTRLTEIIYPPTPNGNNISNVYYEYGLFGNAKGRLVTQYDATGREDFSYGNMGEIINTRRLIVGPNIPTRLLYTDFNYDSWNRIKSIRYPDGENVTYTYDLGGNLSKVSGTVNGDPYDYVSRIDYDHFEQRTYLKYGNNTETSYEYIPSLRRLQFLNAKTASNESFLKNEYSYDKIGNITKLHNTATPNIYNGMGGGSLNTYGYDNLNRLITSDGSFSGDAGSQQPLNNDYSSNYHLDMEYDNTHGITMKKQFHYKNSQPVQDNFMVSNYSYPQDSHKLETVQNQATGITEQFVYDNNGNLQYHVNVTQNTAKMHTWDESNRLRAVTDDYSMQHYIYDASGERVLKGSAQPEQLYNNGMPVDGDMSFDTYTIYPSAYIVINGDGQFSKHYYAGSQRIVSRVSEEDASMFESLVTRPAAVDPASGAEKGKHEFSEDKLRKLQISDLTAILAKTKKGTPVFKKYRPAGTEEQNEPEEEREETINETSGPVTNMLPPATALYFYHPDHLGSSIYLTDANGELYQFFLNLPFGETMAEQHSLTQDYQTPYKFNGKELDRETGYYYYGARYYNPRISIWLSVDQKKDKYPGINPYVYCAQNPINIIDPDGKDIIYVNKNGSITKVIKDGKSTITIMDGGKANKLSDYDISWSLFSPNNRNRQIVANIAGYYGRKVGITGVGATYKESGIAHYEPTDGNIYIAPTKNGKPSKLFNNINNLQNALVHENFHKTDAIEEVPTTFFTHASVYLNQMQDPTFKNTSMDFAEGMMYNFIRYLTGAKTENDDNYTQLIKEFNNSNIKGGYKIRDRDSGGMQLFNKNGNELTLPLDLPLFDAH